MIFNFYIGSVLTPRIPSFVLISRVTCKFPLRIVACNFLCCKCGSLYLLFFCVCRTGAACAIIMFDISSLFSYFKVHFWYRLISKVCGKEIHIVLCWNKVDLAETNVQVKRHKVIFHNTHENVEFYEVSALANHNFERIFLHLARKLFVDHTLQIDTDSYTLSG